jgi:hypothetical protein
MAQAASILCAAAAGLLAVERSARLPLAEAVYVLCAATSLACAVLLVRGYRRSRARFLLWSSLCFLALALNNVLLFVDKVVYADVEMPNLALARSAVALVGLALLVYGLVWDAE